MSDESFLDMYLLNPIQALRQYFKHSIVPAHEERIKQWNIDLKELVKLNKREKDNPNASQSLINDYFMELASIYNRNNPDNTIEPNDDNGLVTLS